MRFDILTIFPGMFEGPLSESILGRAREAGHIQVQVHDLRGWAHDRHRTVDDYPFGGGAGMVMKPEPLFEAIEAVSAMAAPPPFRVFLSPQGRRLDRALVRELAAQDRLLLLCGRYEGVDERVLEHAIDLEVSVGDFVVSGGELPAMLLLDAVARCIPGVLGSEGSLDEESFDEGLLEYPQYTRPAEFRGWTVPDVLLSGNHAAIEAWRRARRIERTASRRPDLLPHAVLSPDERAVVLGERGEAERRVGDTLLRVRVATVLLDAGRVLVEAGESGWSLPGGTMLVGERVDEAARRVLRDVAGMKAEPGAILGVDEQLDDVEPPGGESAAARHHDITILVEAVAPARFTRRESFRAGAGTHFRWIAVSDLAEGSIRPAGGLAALRRRLDDPAGG